MGERIKAVNHSAARSNLSGHQMHPRDLYVYVSIISVFLPHSVGVCAQGLPETLSPVTPSAILNLVLLPGHLSCR